MEEIIEKKQKIIILENEQCEGERLAKAVDKLGYKYQNENNIKKVIEILKENDQEIILIIFTDITKNPLELEPIVKLICEKIGVVIYGMDKDGKIALYCLQNGVSDFLKKPLNEKELETVINGLSEKINSKSKNTSGRIAVNNPMLNWIELTANSEVEHLRIMQRFSEVLLSLKLPEKMAEDIKLAIEEVSGNAVEWGNRFNPEKKIRISYCVFNDRIVIKVEDEGEGFDPQILKDPTLNPFEHLMQRQEEGKRPGGYGVYILRKLMDDVVYNEKGNVVVMTKYLNENIM